jgi:hypothetical protein
MQVNINFKINILPLLGAAAALLVTWGTVAGLVQEYVYFADPINEMGFAICAFWLGLILLFSAVEKNKKLN